MRATTHPVRGVVIAIALAAAICLAGYWEFEQVDSGSIGSYVAIDKTSDGTIWLAYVNRDSAIRLAHRDSAWEFEDLDTAMVRPMFPSAYYVDDLPFSFDIGPNDVIGVVGLARLAERRDSGWSFESLPMPMRGLSLSYDPAGRPSLTFKDSLYQGCLGVKTDSGWDTNVVFLPSEYTWFYTLSRPAWRRGEGCAFMWAEVWSDHQGTDGYGVGLLKRDGGRWTDDTIVWGYSGGSSGFAALVDSSDSIHTFWSASDPHGTNELFCDTVLLDSATDIGAACLDDADRVQCAWAPWSGGLKFGIPGHETWVVQDTGNPVWCDVTTDHLSQPVIAFCRDDGSIWVAHGVDVVGLSEDQQTPTANGSRPTATVIRSVLLLQEASGRKPQATRCLLDISGRKVLDLTPGANDVSTLPLGVYFVHSVLDVKADAPSVTKVVIAR